MINENDLLEPRKAYEEVLKEEHKRIADEYYEDLVKKSGLDVEANQAAYQSYLSYKQQEVEVVAKKKKKQSLSSFLIVMGIILIIASVVCAIIGIGKGADSGWVFPVIGIVVPIVLFALALFLLIFNGVKIRPVIKNQSVLIERYRAAQNEQKALGYQQMQQLNKMFTWNMHVDIVNKTTPLFNLDKYFDFNRLEYMIDSFGFKQNLDKDACVVHVQSGQILGNPFVIETFKMMAMGTYTYTGSLTITYRVRVPNGGKNGGYHYETRTQTLHASLTKPKPYYNYGKKLYYGCEAAPELSFSRIPSGINEMDEGDQKKYIAKQEKELAKMCEKNAGGKFTALGNKQFEALFHAWDRNNEVQFRLLFTPLAQKNYLDLIKNKEPYGDDFTIQKEGKINTVITKHSQYNDYVCEPGRFESFSYQESKAEFLKYNEEYFKSFFFDMAALISIPLYQQYPTDDYIFNKKIPGNNTMIENEAIANAFDKSDLEPAKNATDIIVKANFVRSEGEADRVGVIAYGHEVKEHLDYVPVMGKDGHWHDVPVHWLEYIPIHKNSQIEVLRHEMTRDEYIKKQASSEYNNFINNNVLGGKLIYRKQFYSFIVPGEQRTYTQDSFRALLSKED